MGCLVYILLDGLLAIATLIEEVSHLKKLLVWFGVISMDRRIVLPLVFVLIVTLFSGIESALAEGNVGVTVGQSAEYTYAFSGTERFSNGTLNTSIPFDVGYLEQITVEDISGTNVTIRVIRTQLNGTMEANLWWVDMSTGEGNAYLVIIPADRNAGEMVYPDWVNTNQTTEGADRITDIVLMKYEDTTIEANHMQATYADDNQTSYWDYYWDKSTGMIIKYTISGTQVAEDGSTLYIDYHFQRVGLEQVFYPLIDNTNYAVTVDSNSAILNFAYNQTEKMLSLNVTGTTGTAGSCDVTVPSGLLWGAFSLSIDGYPLVEGDDYTQTYNGTYYIFHISYIHSTHTIDIVASNDAADVPEPTEPEPTTPEPTEPAEAPFITTETAIIVAVVVACIIGVAAYWALKKRK
jgi:hypothetical protein